MKKHYKTNKIFLNKRGFTLVELLVVISIIGLLSSFAMVSLTSARMKARDALRKGDMAQLRTALVLYFDDNGRYPICDEVHWNAAWGAGDEPMGSAPAEGSVCYNDVIAPALESGSRPIMEYIPRDPLNKTNDPGVRTDLLYRYISNSGGLEYAVIYYLEEDITTPQVMRGW